MNEFPILSLTIFLPLIGAIALFLGRDQGEVAENRARWVALLFSGAAFALTLLLLAVFDHEGTGFQFEEKQAWLPALNIFYHVGVDGISVWLVMLTAMVTLMCVLASWTAITFRVREYMIAFLVLETFALGTFTALDFMLFYLFYEGSLIPMFLVIGVWGEVKRANAALKLFLYTMAGSVFLLLSILVLYQQVGTFDIPTLMASPVGAELQTWLWLAMFVSFAIKMPLWPVHTWLPDVHIEAPTAGSMFLAGVMMKFGAYGFLRFLLPMMPDASIYFAPLVFTLGVVTLIYNSVVALAQTNIKRLLAYVTVAHMGVTAVGVFARNVQSIEGTILLMVAQGAVAAALFLGIGIIHERFKSYDLDRLGGIAIRMPICAGLMMVMSLAAMALPGTANFMGEILVLVGAFQVNTWVAFLLATVIVLAPAYMLRLYHGTMFGKRAGDVPLVRDLSLRETLAFVPVIAVVLWLGIHPPTMMNDAAATVAHLVGGHPKTLAAAPGEVVVAQVR